VLFHYLLMHKTALQFKVFCYKTIYTLSHQLFHKNITALVLSGTGSGTKTINKNKVFYFQKLKTRFNSRQLHQIDN